MVSRDDTVWFSEIGSNRIGQLNPISKKIREYDIPTPNSEPHNLFESEDGMIWFTEFEATKLEGLIQKRVKSENFLLMKGTLMI